MNVKTFLKRNYKSIIIKELYLLDDIITEKNYNKIDKSNITIENNITIPFEELYSRYIQFKNLGKLLYKYNDINKITYTNDDLEFTWPIINSEQSIQNQNLIINYINRHNYFVAYKTIRNNKYQIDEYELASLSIFIHLITDSLKSFSESDFDVTNIQKSEEKFKRIIKIDKDKAKAFDTSHIQIIPKAVSTVEDKNPKYKIVNEILKYEEEDNVLETYICFENIYSLFFHLFKLELVFYSHRLEEKDEIQSICPNCLKYKPNNHKLCDNCNTLFATERRNKNKKCKVMRENIKKYIEKYNISNKLKLKAEKYINKKHCHDDYNNLKEILDEIIKETTN